MPIKTQIKYLKFLKSQICYDNLHQEIMLLDACFVYVHKSNEKIFYMARACPKEEVRDLHYIMKIKNLTFPNDAFLMYFQYSAQKKK